MRPRGMLHAFQREPFPCQVADAEDEDRIASDGKNGSMGWMFGKSVAELSKLGRERAVLVSQWKTLRILAHQVNGLRKAVKPVAGLLGGTVPDPPLTSLPQVAVCLFSE